MKHGSTGDSAARLLSNRPSLMSGVGVIDTVPQALSILVVEDDPGDFGLVNAYLRQAGFWHDDDKSSLVRAETLAEAILAAGHMTPDLVLLDLFLPDSSGIETVEAINTALPDIPIVVFTGHDDNDLALAALQAGAQDYLVKGQLDHTVLARAVRYALVRGKLESHLRLFEAALKSAANGIVITDIEGRVQWVNPAFTQLTGFPAAEALGRNPGELVKSGRHDQAFYRKVGQNRSNRLDKQWSGRDMDIRIVRLNCQPTQRLLEHGFF